VTAVALAAAGWVLGWLLAGRRRPLPPAGPAPSCSVIVPARDEERRLPTLLAALARAEGVGEVVVVDDRSADATADLAAAAGARVLHAPEPPPGWTGKAHACWLGAGSASGEVLVFLDADVEPEPGVVVALARAAAASGGLVSAQPWHAVARPYELLSAVPNLVAVLGAGSGAAGRRWWHGPAAFGPAVAVPAGVYHAAGGHAAVRASVVDDLALAAAVAASGAPVMTVGPDRRLRYRMYPEGIRSLVEGWSKNLAAGATSIAPARAAAVALWVTGALVAGTFAAGPVAYAAYAGQALVLLRRVGRFGALAPVFPVGVLAFVVLFVLSVGKRAIGRAAWRGRTVELGRVT
jgi:hypothetical protein